MLSESRMNNHEDRGTALEYSVGADCDVDCDVAWQIDGDLLADLEVTEETARLLKSFSSNK
jgi:hypothetical protein